MSQNPRQDTAPGPLPLLPLRDVVVYPQVVVPLFVGREKSIRALDAVMGAHKRILLVTQRDASVDDPGAGDLHAAGTLATVLQLLKLPDGTVKVLVEGGARARITGLEMDGAFPLANYELVEESAPPSDAEAAALRRTLNAQFEQYVSAGKKVPAEVVTMVSGLDDLGRLTDTMAMHMALTLEQKQEVLELFDIRARVDRILRLIEGELEVLQVEQRIRGRVKKQMEKSQRENR